MVYSVTAGLLALFVFWRCMSTGKTTGKWSFVLAVSSFVLGSAPLIGGLLPSLLNWVINLVSNAVFQQSIPMNGGVYSGTVIVLCVAAVIAVLWDGRVTGFEKWLLVVACFALGSTPLITSWLPGLLDQALALIPGVA